MSSGYIYRIVDHLGRMYVGSSVNVAKRWRQHKHELLKGVHHSPRLQNIVKKYGFDCLKFEIIETVEDGDIADREQYYIDALKPELNGLSWAGPKRMHKDSYYRKRLKEGLALANLRPEYRQARRNGAKAIMRAVRCENDGRIFDSCSEAARFYGITSGSVSSCCQRQTIKTRGGLVFSYINGGDPQRTSNFRRSAVMRRDTEEQFESVMAAAKAIGVTRAAIHSSIRNGWKCGGTYWSIVEVTKQ